MSDDKAPEMIGGSNDFDDRTPPGMERGGTRAQREPIIGKGKSPSGLKKLEAQALSVSEFCGHNSSVWRYEPEAGWGQIRCADCQAVASFALHPMVKDEPISGPAVTDRCGT